MHMRRAYRVAGLLWEDYERMRWWYYAMIGCWGRCGLACWEVNVMILLLHHNCSCPECGYVRTDTAAAAGCGQIQPNQFSAECQDIARIHFFNSRRFLTWQAIQCQWSCLSDDLLFLSFSWALELPYVQCSKNRLTCENYTANYIIFQEHHLNSRRFPVFPGAISNCRRFSG